MQIHVTYNIYLGFTQCPELSILNGVVEYHGIDNQLEPRDPDTVATYSCSGDYILEFEGERTRKCSRDGEWLGKEPKCKATQNKHDHESFIVGSVGRPDDTCN